MDLDKRWRILAMIFIALALLMPVAAAFPGIGTENTVNRTHEGIQGGTGTGEYTIRFTTTAQQPGSYPAENAEIDKANIGWYEMTRGNEPPNITQIYITSSSGLNLTTDDITCWVNATDSDNTTLIINYNWYNQSVQIPSLSGQATATSGIITNISTINSALTTIGENWTCEARAWDGYYNEPEWNNASIIIEQILPPGGSKGLSTGAGGGGVIRKETKECSEAWACTEWSSCNITRTRNCTDINNCGKEQYRPALTEICELRPVQRSPITIVETIKREQEQEKQPAPIIELPMQEYVPTALELARIKSGIIRETTVRLITTAIQKSIDIQTEALHKTIDTISKTINTLKLIITKSSQEQAGIITKIFHAIEEILKTVISLAKATILGTIQVIKGAIHLSIEAAETAINSARDAAAKTTAATKERTATAAETAAIIIAVLTPENIEFILAAIIYLALIAAAIIAIKYFIRQYTTEERSRRLRTETRALLAISIILQAVHFIIFQRELYPAYLSTLAIITVLIVDWLIRAIPPKLRKQEQLDRERTARLLEANKEEIEEAEKLSRKLWTPAPPAAPEKESALSREEKYRLTRARTAIEQIKEGTYVPAARAEKKPLKEMLKDLARLAPEKTRQIITRKEEQELSKASELNKELERFLSKQRRTTEETALSRKEENRYEQLKRLAKEITAGTRKTETTRTIEEMRGELRRLEPTPIEKLRRRIQEIKEGLAERKEKKRQEEQKKQAEQKRSEAQQREKGREEIRKTIEFERKLDRHALQETRPEPLPATREQEEYRRRKEKIREILKERPAEKEFEAIEQEIKEIEKLKPPLTERIKNTITQYLERRKQQKAQEEKRKELTRTKQQEQKERRQKQLEQERKEEQRKTEALLKKQQEEKKTPKLQQILASILKHEETPKRAELTAGTEKNKEITKELVKVKQFDKYITKPQKTERPELPGSEKIQRLKEQIRKIEDRKKLNTLEKETKAIDRLLAQAEQTARDAEPLTRIPPTEKQREEKKGLRKKIRLEKARNLLKNIFAGKTQKAPAKEKELLPEPDRKTRKHLREETEKTKSFEKEFDKYIRKTKEHKKPEEQPEEKTNKINEIQRIAGREREIDRKERKTAQQIRQAIKEYSHEERKEELRGLKEMLAGFFRKPQQEPAAPAGTKPIDRKTYQKIRKEIQKTIKLEKKLEKSTSAPNKMQENGKTKRRTPLDRLRDEINSIRH